MIIQNPNTNQTALEFKKKFMDMKFGNWISIWNYQKHFDYNIQYSNKNYYVLKIYLNQYFV